MRLAHEVLLGEEWAREVDWEVESLAGLVRVMAHGVSGEKPPERTALHEGGCGGVYLPLAYGEKVPSARTSWPWFWIFPSGNSSADPRSHGLERRHHTHEGGVSP